MMIFERVLLLVLGLMLLSVLSASKLRGKDDFEETYSKLFGNGHIAGPQLLEELTHPKVSVEVYYEALCPYCQSVKNFFILS